VTPNELIIYLVRDVLDHGSPPFELVVAHPDAALAAAWRACTTGDYMLRLAARCAPDPTSIRRVERDVLGLAVKALRVHEPRVAVVFRGLRLPGYPRVVEQARALRGEYTADRFHAFSKSVQHAMWAVEAFVHGEVFTTTSNAIEAYARVDPPWFNERERTFAGMVADRVRRLPPPTWAALFKDHP